MVSNGSSEIGFVTAVRIEVVVRIAVAVRDCCPEVEEMAMPGVEALWDVIDLCGTPVGGIADGGEVVNDSPVDG